MNDYEQFKHNIIVFLKEYFSTKGIDTEPKEYKYNIEDEIFYNGILITIDIIIKEFVSDIILIAYFNTDIETSKNNEVLTIQDHIHNISNENMQGINVIKAFLDVFPRFEKIINLSKAVMEEQWMILKKQI